MGEHGVQQTRMGQDGETRFHSYTERASHDRIVELESQIEALPKTAKIRDFCDFLRGGVKAQLIEETHLALDVVVVDYGYQGPVVACVLKYMYAGQVGTQLVFAKGGAKGMYTLYVAD